MKLPNARKVQLFDELKTNMQGGCGCPDPLLCVMAGLDVLDLIEMGDAAAVKSTITLPRRSLVMIHNESLMHRVVLLLCRYEL